MICLLTLLGIYNAPLQAHDNGSRGYVHDTAGKLILNSRGDCIRTPQWSAETAIPKCEGMSEAKVMDADNDGIADNADNCPATPAGASVDATGCEKDSDNDGVADSADDCPATPAGARVNATGCERDSDKDGVADALDRCPATPAGYPVDAGGCPTDSDADGIADGGDKCPGTASGAVVDTTGCELQADISLENVLFNTGTAELNTESRRILRQVTGVLAANRHLSFEIAGHTDSAGNYDNNVKLSEERARSVMQFLVDNGIAPERLRARGYGPDRPLASNDTAAGRSKNRRVELVRIR